MRINWTIIVFLFVVWIGFFVYFIHYGEELKKHPCSLCAEAVGEDVVCSTLGEIRTYDPEGKIIQITWEDFQTYNVTAGNLSDN